MSLRAMNLADAKLAKAFVEKFGKVARLKDLNEFRASVKTGVSFILARSTKVKRGEFDFTQALTAAEAVLAGQADPSAPAKAVKPVKAKAVKAKAPAKAKTVKSASKPKSVKATKSVKTKAPKVTPTVTAPATVEQLIEKIDQIEQTAKA